MNILSKNNQWNIINNIKFYKEKRLKGFILSIKNYTNSNTKIYQEDKNKLIPTHMIEEVKDKFTSDFIKNNNKFLNKK